MSSLLIHPHEKRTRPVCLAAISLAAGNGGIARVGRLMARVLAEQGKANKANTRLLSFNDLAPGSDTPLPMELVRGSRWRFVWQILRQCRGDTRFIYDGCHLAQVHRLPVVSRFPFLLFLHGIEVWEKAKPSYVRTAHRARMLLANSHYTLARTGRLHGPFPQARVCWLATETDDLPSPRVPSPSPPVVLIVASMRLTESKGHRELIDCWPRVVEAVPDAILNIVGGGNGQAILQDQAARSPAASRIVFSGFVTEAQLEQAYRQAAVYCMPSRQEGFGLVYIEAMRHALPVVASIHDAAPEVVLDGQTGYTVNLDKPDELPERLIHLLRNPDQARQLGANGHRRWQEHFRFSAFRDRFLPILHEFLDSP